MSTKHKQCFLAYKISMRECVNGNLNFGKSELVIVKDLWYDYVVCE
jgi:hypothetical protein